MKRNRSGTVIHRDDCPKAGRTVHWNWADGMSDEEMFVRVLAYGHLRLCLSCFGGTKEQLAIKAARQQ